MGNPQSPPNFFSEFYYREKDRRDSSKFLKLSGLSLEVVDTGASPHKKLELVKNLVNQILAVRQPRSDQCLDLNVDARPITYLD